MKIKDYKCRCGHDDFYLFTPENCIGENHVGIYCSYCGKWFKWADKDEKNLAMNCVTKIRNDLIKNGDDLIKRQDAIGKIKDWMKFIGYSHSERNVMECTIQMLEELPSVQKTGKWLEKNCVYSEESHIEDWQSCCCSVCGHYDTRPYMYYFDEPNYCSFCGARME